MNKLKLPLIVILCVLAGNVPAKSVFGRRIVRVTGNLSVVSTMNSVKDIMKRASGKGYNGIFYDDSKIPILKRIGTNGINRLKDLKATADGLGLALMPMCMVPASAAYGDIGHSECFPVKETQFAVSGGQAVVQSDHAVKIENGDFEAGMAGWSVGGRCNGSWSGCKADGFVFEDASGKSGKCVRVENPNGYFLLIRPLTLKPHRAYRLKIWIKTQNYTRSNKLAFKVFDPGSKKYLLDRRSGGFKTWADWTFPQKTQNWTQYWVDFNSLDKSLVNLWIVATEMEGTGKVWFDEATIEEIGLFENIRRADLPVVVKSSDGSKTYAEGTDYAVESEKLTIPAGSAIADGSKLKVSWFQLADVITSPPSGSYCHDGAWAYLWEQSERIKAAFMGPRGWFLKPSEWRVAFWSSGCVSQYGGNAGKYYGDVLKKMHDMMRGVMQDCNTEAYVWNDNYDPYHNAAGIYYLVNGSIYESWNYMDPKTIIINWNVHHRLKSLLFYAGMDTSHKSDFPLRQIVSSHNGSTNWLDRLDEAKNAGMPDSAVVGIQYCTWAADYTKIESLAAACVSRGHWASGSYPFDPVSKDCTLPTKPGIRAAVVPALSQSGMTVTAARGQGITVRYQIGHETKMLLRLTDALGRTVRRIDVPRQVAGTHQASFSGEGLAPGLYLVSMVCENEPNTSKQVLVRKAVFLGS